MELYDFGWADHYDIPDWVCNSTHDVVVRTDFPAVERLIFYDRPANELKPALTPERSLWKHRLFLFQGAKFSAYIMEVRGLTLKGEITMMKALKNFMNDWFNILGYCCTITAVIYGGMYAWNKLMEKLALKKTQESDLEDYEI